MLGSGASTPSPLRRVNGGGSVPQRYGAPQMHSLAPLEDRRRLLAAASASKVRMPLPFADTDTWLLLLTPLPPLRHQASSWRPARRQSNGRQQRRQHRHHRHGSGGRSSLEPLPGDGMGGEGAGAAPARGRSQQRVAGGGGSSSTTAHAPHGDCADDEIDAMWYHSGAAAAAGPSPPYATAATTAALRGVGGWAPERVAQWVGGIEGISREVARNFIAHEVRGRDLLQLRREDLRELGVGKVAHLRRLLDALERLRSSEQPAFLTTEGLVATEAAEAAPLADGDAAAAAAAADGVAEEIVTGECAEEGARAVGFVAATGEQARVPGTPPGPAAAAAAARRRGGGGGASLLPVSPPPEELSLLMTGERASLSPYPAQRLETLLPASRSHHHHHHPGGGGGSGGAQSTEQGGSGSLVAAEVIPEIEGAGDSITPAGDDATATAVSAAALSEGDGGGSAEMVAEAVPEGGAAAAAASAGGDQAPRVAGKRRSADGGWGVAPLETATAVRADLSGSRQLHPLCLGTS
jgi:hypothetical protein